MLIFLEITSWFALITGAVFCIVGGIGLIKFPEFYSRTHAASITDTLGAGLILAGLMLQALEPLAEHGIAVLDSPTPNPVLLCFKIGLVGLFILLTSPTAGHALVKAAYSQGLRGGTLSKDSDDSH